MLNVEDLQRKNKYNYNSAVGVELNYQDRE